MLRLSEFSVSFKNRDSSGLPVDRACGGMYADE